jgi:mono/diheme cytochrome c family protein
MMMRARRFTVSAPILVAVLCGISFGSTATVAQTAKPERAAVDRGKASFRESCAACHGEGGKGNGPAPNAMKHRPTNLSALARQKGGFRASDVEASIKGTSQVVAHGSPGMMVWGAFFLADANGNQARADARIRDLVAFIESIQVK